MASLSIDVWNEIQGVLNRQNTDCLEVQIEKRDGTIRNAYKLSKTIKIILYYNHILSKLSIPTLKVKAPAETS